MILVTPFRGFQPIFNPRHLGNRPPPAPITSLGAKTPTAIAPQRQHPSATQTMIDVPGVAGTTPRPHRRPEEARASLHRKEPRWDHGAVY